MAGARFASGLSGVLVRGSAGLADFGRVVVPAADGAGEPGQEPVQCQSRGGLAVTAGAEVAGQVFQRFEVVAFGGGGDGPDPGGQVRGPFGVAAVVVLPPDDRGARGTLGLVVVQVQVREVAVAGQAVPFAVQGGQDLFAAGCRPGPRGWVRAVSI